METKTEAPTTNSQPPEKSQAPNANHKGNANPNGRMYVEIGRLKPDPEQPRKNFEAGPLKELAESIKEQGIVQDLLVLAAGPGFIILDGERRWRAAKLAGLESVPIAIREPNDRLVLQLTANQQRENLSALEEAGAYRRKLDAGAKAEELAKELGMSRAKLFGRLRLNELEPASRKALEEGKISLSVAGLVAMVPSADREEFIQEIGGTKWDGPKSFRQVQDEVERWVKQLGEAGFDQKRDYGQSVGASERRSVKSVLISKTCDTCPKRSGNIPESGLKSPNVCTGPECFDEKTRRAAAERIAEAKAKGLAVLAEKESPFDDRGALSYNSPWVDLANRCDALGYDYKNHWKAALGEKCPVVTMAVDKQGKAHELVKKAAAAAALKETEAWKKAWKRQSVGASERKDWKAQQAKQRAEEKLRQAENSAIAAALVSKAEGLKEIPEWLWRMAARTVDEYSSYDQQQSMEKRRGWGNEHGKQLAALTLGQTAGFMVEMVTGNEDEQNLAGKMLKVDIKQVVNVAREEAKPKGPPKGGRITKEVCCSDEPQTWSFWIGEEHVAGALTKREANALLSGAQALPKRVEGKEEAGPGKKIAAKAAKAAKKGGAK